MSLNIKEFKKYSKQIILKKVGFAGQKRLKKSKVLIVGAGGLGCPLLIYLVNTGIGSIGIVDHDKVEISNLNRQILYSSDDIGKYKVVQAQKKIKKYNSKLKLKVFKKKLSKNNIKNIFSQYDIICDGTDNYITRLLINDYCKKMKKILISAAISEFQGHLFKFDFQKKTSCFRCFMPIMPENELNCSSNGVMPSIAGILGSLQANEVVRTILNFKPNLSSKLIIFDGLKLKLREVKILKNNMCENKC